jgi:5,10-methylenetetrahydromethanopterin reductase
MRTSLLTYLGDSQGGGSPVDAYVRDLRAARDQGFDFAWTVQLPWEHDALITLAVALREVDGIRVGTGMQPIQTRHPRALAQAALTLSAGGPVHPRDRTQPCRRQPRDVGHRVGSPGATAQRVPRLPAAAVDHRRSGRSGADNHRARADPGTRRLTTAGLPRGTRTADAADRRSPDRGNDHLDDRTAHPRRLRRPDAAGGSRRRGRQAEVIAALPICVTDDPAKARATAAEIYAVYGTLPSYRAMLDREGAEGPADVAIIGDEQAVTERIEEIRAAGVAEISAHVFGANPEERDRTRAFLRPPQALPRSNPVPAD